MTARSLVGCVLVVLASLSVIEMAADGSTGHAALRHQVRALHHAASRVPPRNMAAAAEEAPPPILAALGRIDPPASPDAAPLPAVAVFVPPRA